MRRCAHLAETHATVLAFSLHLLSRVTLRANQFGERFAVKVVLLVFVVTVSTLVEFATARRLFQVNNVKVEKNIIFMIQITFRILIIDQQHIVCTNNDFIGHISVCHPALYN